MSDLNQDETMAMTGSTAGSDHAPILDTSTSMHNDTAPVQLADQPSSIDATSTTTTHDAHEPVNQASQSPPSMETSSEVGSPPAVDTVILLEPAHVPVLQETQVFDHAMPVSGMTMHEATPCETSIGISSEADDAGRMEGLTAEEPDIFSATNETAPLSIKLASPVATDNQGAQQRTPDTSSAHQAAAFASSSNSTITNDASSSLSNGNGAWGEPLSSAGITAVAHVYAADVGVSLQNETVDAIHYDDATQLLMVTKGGVVFAYDLAMDAPGHHEQLVWTYPLQEGPRVTSLRCSLDRQLLGCLRGGLLLELVELATGITTAHKAERADLLGFFFTEAPGADVVLVGRSGLSLLEFAARRHGLRCRERLKTAADWYMWTHETRCCLVATGPPGAQFIQAWQFVTGGTITLPPFVVGAGPAAAAVLMSGPAGLPMPMPAVAMPLPPQASATAAIAAVAAAARGGGSVSQRHVRLLKLYGRVYCAYINAAASKLELYRFYTDTVSLQLSYELFSTNIDLSVVDHVLIVHHLDSAMTMLIDVAADESDMPVTHPLPLAVLHPPPPPPRQALPPAPLSPPPYQPVQHQNPQQPAAVRRRQQQQGPRGIRSSGSVELTHWEFIAPSTVIDRGHQAVYRLYLDLRAVADSCSNTQLLASFLQRRRSPPLPELAVAPKQLLLLLLRSGLQEQLPPAMLRRVFHEVCKAWADVRAAAAKAGARASPAAAAAVLSPDEVATQVFQWMQSQQEVPLDALYLQSALSEYLAVALAYGLTLPVSLLAQQVDLALLQGQPDQAAVLVYCLAAQQQQKLLQPAAAGVAAAASSAAPAVTSAGADAKELTALSDLLRASSLHGSGAVARAAAATIVASSGLLSDCMVACTPPAWSNPGAMAAPGAESTIAPAASSSSSGSGANHGGSAEALVRHLLDSGRVLEAARTATRLKVISVHPRDMLRAAAKHGDEVAFASVYRCFRDALMPFYPKLEVAKSQLMPA